MLILGLTSVEVDHLVAGQPIRFECADIGLRPMQVSIVYGETNQAIMEEIGPAARNARLRPDPAGGSGG
jgi:hypothetical protein